jgi:hypothetical protein
LTPDGRSAVWTDTDATLAGIDAMREPDHSTAGHSSPPRQLLFVKIEATGVETGAFPIEIGWCNVFGRGESH